MLFFSAILLTHVQATSPYCPESLNPLRRVVGHDYSKNFRHLSIGISDEYLFRAAAGEDAAADVAESQLLDAVLLRGAETAAKRSLNVFGKFRSPHPEGKCEILERRASAEEDEGAADGRRPYGRRKPAGGGAPLVHHRHRGIHIHAVSPAAGQRGEGDVLRREEIALIKPPELAEYLRPYQERGPRNIGCAEHLPRERGPPDRIILRLRMQMPLLKDIIACRIRWPPAELERKISIDKARGHDGGTLRKPSEVGYESPDDILADFGIVIEDKAEPAPGTTKGQIVVLRKAARLPTLYKLHPREISPGLRQIVSRKTVCYHESLIRDGHSMLPKAAQTGIQII